MAGAANPAMTMNPFQGAAQATMAAGQAFANPNVNQFMNPYQQQVVDATIRDVGNAAQMGLNNIGAQAQRSGAYGGSRQGVMEAEALKGFNQQAKDSTLVLCKYYKSSKSQTHRNYQCRTLQSQTPKSNAIEGRSPQCRKEEEQTMIS